MEKEIFETQYGSRHKQIAMWKGVRIAFVNELLINENKMKMF